MKPSFFFTFVKLQVAVPPGGTFTLQVVEPIGAKLALTPSLTVNVPGATPEKVTVPLPATVEMVAVAVIVPDLRVKVKLPLPPTVFLVTTIEPKATLLKLQSVCIPALTVKVIGPEPLGPRGGGGGGRTPALQVALANTKPESTISLRVKVPGASALKVVLPVPPIVVTVALMVTELLSTKVKLPLPLPPTVFLVTTTEPKADRKSV